jgi:uncharacterized membrane protein YfcA
MDWSLLPLIGLGLFVAGLLKGTTGLGYSSCALPFLVAAIDLKTAIVLVLAPAMASNLTLIWSAGHFRETVWRFRVLYLALVPGIACGIAMLIVVDQSLATRFLGVLTILYALIALTQPQLSLTPRLEFALQLPVGLINGVFTGLTGSQIMPLLPYMLSLRLDADRFVQDVNLSVALASLVMAFGLALAGVMSPALAALSVLGVLPAILGVSLGNAVRRYLPAAVFRTFVLLVLALTGLSLVVPPDLVRFALAAGIG